MTIFQLFLSYYTVGGRSIQQWVELMVAESRAALSWRKIEEVRDLLHEAMSQNNIVVDWIPRGSPVTMLLNKWGYDKDQQTAIHEYSSIRYWWDVLADRVLTPHACLVFAEAVEAGGVTPEVAEKLAPEIMAFVFVRDLRNKFLLLDYGPALGDALEVIEVDDEDILPKIGKMLLVTGSAEAAPPGQREIAEQASRKRLLFRKQPFGREREEYEAVLF